MNYLTLENVTKSYGPKILFQNISLNINKGERIALVAKNGTGKTTLLRVLAGTEGVECNVSTLPNGLYFVTLVVGNQRFMKKF